MEEHHLIAVLREDLEDLVRCQEEDGAGADVVTGEGLHHGEAALPGHLPAGQVLAGALAWVTNTMEAGSLMLSW